MCFTTIGYFKTFCVANNFVFDEIISQIDNNYKYHTFFIVQITFWNKNLD